MSKDTQTYWAADLPFPDPDEPRKIEWFPLHPSREEAQAESDEWYDGVVYEVTVTRHERREVVPPEELGDKAKAMADFFGFQFVREARASVALDGQTITEWDGETWTVEDETEE